MERNDRTQNDFVFGRPTADFKEDFSQPKFTEMLQKHSPTFTAVALPRLALATLLLPAPTTIPPRPAIPHFHFIPHCPLL